MFFFLQILLKQWITSIEQYVFRSPAFRPFSFSQKLIYSSSHSRQRHFFSSLGKNQLGFRAWKLEVDRWDICLEAGLLAHYIIDRWYIARIFQIWSTPAGNKELAGGCEPIRKGEIV